ncbi:MAG TPA: hypothetical protein VF235_01865 [Actinomycetota bacterium]
MTHGKKIALVIAASAVALAATGIALAVGGDETPLTGDALRSASRAALAQAGGGEVVETEAGDGGAAYEVEIRLADGSVVEIQLDEDFTVIGSEADDDGVEGADPDGDED